MAKKNQKSTKTPTQPKTRAQISKEKKTKTIVQDLPLKEP